MNPRTTSSLRVILTNTGNANETIAAVSATGAGSSSSGVSAGTKLAPNQTAMLIVALDPITPGGCHWRADRDEERLELSGCDFAFRHWCCARICSAVLDC
ncbi:MAG: hypothetical protein WAM58_02315, partial [Candidatus Acidiferrum sp.]